MSTPPSTKASAVARVSALNRLINDICNGTFDPDADYDTKVSAYFTASIPESSGTSPKPTSAPMDAALPAAGRADDGMLEACQRYCEQCKWEYYNSSNLTCQRCAEPTVCAAARRERLLRACVARATQLGVILRRRQRRKQWLEDRGLLSDEEGWASLHMEAGPMGLSNHGI